MSPKYKINLLIEIIYHIFYATIFLYRWRKRQPTRWIAQVFFFLNIQLRQSEWPWTRSRSNSQICSVSHCGVSGVCDSSHQQNIVISDNRWRDTKQRTHKLGPEIGQTATYRKNQGSDFSHAYVFDLVSSSIRDEVFTQMCWVGAR